MRLAKGCLLFLLCGALAGCGEKPLAEFKDPGGKFTIQFPGTPKSLTTKGQGGISVNVLTVEGSSWAYTLTYYDIQANVPDNDNAATIALFHEVGGIYEGLKGKEDNHEVIKLQDQYVGAEHSGTATHPKDLKVRGRTYLVNNRVYTMIVLGNDDKIKSETATKFLDSFKVIRPKEEGEEGDKEKKQ